ncbi:hypothetical protein Tsubulata_010738, partial [Turnera subulata]
MGDNMITPEVREGENEGSFKFVLMAARNLEKIVISPTPNFIYKIILLSLPRASPRAVMVCDPQSGV